MRWPNDVVQTLLMEFNHLPCQLFDYIIMISLHFFKKATLALLCTSETPGVLFQCIEWPQLARRMVENCVQVVDPRKN